MGEGIPQDYKEAELWYSRAADQGEVSSQTNLGVMYFKGLTGETDYSKAYKYLLQGAEGGDPNAQANIGLMFKLGLGVDQDYTNAYMWFLTAATNGNAKARSQMEELKLIMPNDQVLEGQRRAIEKMDTPRQRFP